MKKIISILLAAVMVMALLAGCGSKNSDKTNDNNTPNNNQNTELSGSVSTNGSTSMDKVIGALREQFMADHKNVTVTYDPTGSGSGIEAVKNGTAHRSGLPQPEGRGEGRRPDRDGHRTGRHRRHCQCPEQGHGPDRGADRQDLHR